MPQAGTRLGLYEVTALIGSGGMGEVSVRFRAPSRTRSDSIGAGGMGEVYRARGDRRAGKCPAPS